MHTILSNKIQYSRFAGLVLAIGFFLACSSSAPTISTMVDGQQYTEALNAIDASLSDNPNQPDLLIQQGQIYLILAEDVDVFDRSEFYLNAVASFNSASEMDLTNDQSITISNELNAAWANELNTGTDLYENQTAENRIDLAIAHFQNATILNPQDHKAYMSLAVALYNSNNLSAAIEALNEAQTTLEDVPDKLYEYLGFLHLQNNNSEQAIFYYELANTDVTANKNIAFGLVNTYILNQQREKAVDLLEQLVIQFPNDARVRNVYGTQLFFIAEGILEDLTDAYIANDPTYIDQLKFEAEGVSEQAEEQLIKAYELESTEQEYVQSLAVFYNNMTAMYLSLSAISADEDKQSFLNKAESLLDFSIQHYQILLSMQPGDPEINASIEMLERLKTNRFSDS
ncbi:MAG: tetratricopeptide repeat protein [Balneolaceae bacterium]|nr:tetratricopeptide repeat protein [Balneolaceae bacterium]